MPTTPALNLLVSPNVASARGYRLRVSAHAALAIFRNSAVTASCSARYSPSRLSKATDSSA